MSEQRLTSMSISAMSTVSMSIVGSYMALIQPRYVITALVLNLFGGFIIASIINPYQLADDELVIEEDKEQTSSKCWGIYLGRLPCSDHCGSDVDRFCGFDRND